MKKILLALVFISNLALADSSSHPWVRVFANKTFEWNKSQFQVFPASSFGHFNWQKGAKHICESDALPGEPGCPIIISSPRSEKALYVFDTLASYELKGISNIDQSNLPVKTKLKKVFGNKVRSCLRAGTLTDGDVSPSLCCSGFINPITNRCQLKDFVDVSIYTNSNVSSEADILSRSLFDKNGFMKKPELVATLACARQMCASNTLAQGILISYLSIPGQEDRWDSKIYRFMEGIASDDVNGLLSLFNQGLKLNTHVYCVPRALEKSTDGLNIYKCEQ